MYKRQVAGIAELRAAGFGILVKDASLGGKYPVMCVTLLNPEDQGCYASFGAHPRFEVALERALTELLQGRALDRLCLLYTSSNYRNFADFHMDGLQRVNLIVGNSNVGKTGLLEGLVILWGTDEHYQALPTTLRMYHGGSAVSYTHPYVYKRQALLLSNSRSSNW